MTSNQKVAVTFKVNGKSHTVEVEPRWLLTDVIRHQLGFNGVHVGCEQGACGACTILIDGKPVRSCLMFAVQAEGLDITTIEGITPDHGLNPLQQSFQDHHALQCGYCTPGMVLTAQALLDKHPHPDEATIREAMSGNLCRCTGYQFIVEAVQATSQSKGGDNIGR